MEPVQRPIKLSRGALGVRPVLSVGDTRPAERFRRRWAAINPEGVKGGIELRIQACGGAGVGGGGGGGALRRSTT
jgi:hypothetical protein